MARSSALGTLWGFLRSRKKWWLTPMIVVLVLFGLLMVFAQSSVLAPFIYAIF
jgi:drug/metabolite transporter superfamily protein YnfA